MSNYEPVLSFHIIINWFFLFVSYIWKWCCYTHWFPCASLLLCTKPFFVWNVWYWCVQLESVLCTEALMSRVKFNIRIKVHSSVWNNTKKRRSDKHTYTSCSYAASWKRIVFHSSAYFRFCRSRFVPLFDINHFGSQPFHGQLACIYMLFVFISPVFLTLTLSALLDTVRSVWLQMENRFCLQWKTTNTFFCQHVSPRCKNTYKSILHKLIEYLM